MAVVGTVGTVAEGIDHRHRTAAPSYAHRSRCGHCATCAAGSSARITLDFRHALLIHTREMPIPIQIIKEVARECRCSTLTVAPCSQSRRHLRDVALRTVSINFNQMPHLSCTQIGSLLRILTALQWHNGPWSHSFLAAPTFCTCNHPSQIPGVWMSRRLVPVGGAWVHQFHLSTIKSRPK